VSSVQKATPYPACRYDRNKPIHPCRRGEPRNLFVIQNRNGLDRSVGLAGQGAERAVAYVCASHGLRIEGSVDRGSMRSFGGAVRPGFWARDFLRRCNSWARLKLEVPAAKLELRKRFRQS
jgi:hypothetical protein